VGLRVAAIDFLNPAPLMWDFTHGPRDRVLGGRYVHLTEPAQCARELLEGRADLGLIPVAALTAGLRVVPGCAIASLRRVRSIQLVVKGSGGLAGVRSVAADTASRSSVAYAQVLFREFLGTDPEFRPAKADVEAMLGEADAALVIGDPALLALERREEIEARVGACEWFDVAEEWGSRTGLPWVAAVWAVRPEALTTAEQARELVSDLNLSREHGVAHVEELVREWTPRIALPAATIRSYLTENIHYALDARCGEAIAEFRRLAAKVGALPELGDLRFLAT
jgi:chorismate dehydratase